MRQSHTFKLPSKPDVTISRPPFFASIAHPVTGPRWASNFNAGVLKFGVHNVTVPFACPRWSTAVSGFWAIVEQEPRPVRWVETSVPVDVSWYLRWPELPCSHGESVMYQNGLSRLIHSIVTVVRCRCAFQVGLELTTVANKKWYGKNSILCTSICCLSL